MATRYEDRDYDRDEQDYGSRRGSEYRRAYGGQAQSRYRYENSDREDKSSDREGRPGEQGGRYSSGAGRERGLGEQYGGRYSSGERGEGAFGNYGDRYSSREGRERTYGGASGGGYSSGRPGQYGGQGYVTGRGEDDWGYTSERDRSYGNYDRFGDESRYGERSSSQQYNYPTGFRSRQSYDDRGDYDRGPYRGQERGFEGERGDYGYDENRGWWDRTADEVASWFGDKEADRRRRMDQQREQFRGRGPKGYRRSDQRITEDVNDRLSEGYLDASDVEVVVLNAEVTLTGSVNSRRDKRLAEDIAESVSGVSNVENRLRVRQSSLDRQPLGTETYGAGGTAGTTGATGNTGAGLTGTTGPSGTSTAATGTTSRSKGAGS